MVTMGNEHDLFAVCCYTVKKHSFLPGCTVIINREVWIKL